MKKSSRLAKLKIISAIFQDNRKVKRNKEKKEPVDEVEITENDFILLLGFL